MQPDDTLEPPQALDSLNEIAYSTLKREILSLHYPPGTRLSERRLAASHELSLNPVRSALARLVADGLLTVRPRSGYVVAPVSPRSARELFEVWSVTVGALAVLAIEKSTADERVEMVRLAERLQNFTHDEAHKGIAEAFDMFECFSTIADNDRISALSLQLRGEIGRFVLMVEQVHQLRPAVIENAHELVSAISGADGHRARAVLEAFINNLGRYAVEIASSLMPDANDTES